MNDDPTQPADGRDQELPSVEQVAHLDAFLDQLVADQRPAPQELTPQELREWLLAAELRTVRADVEVPTPAFLQQLERQVGQAVANEQVGQPVADEKTGQPAADRPSRVSRGRFLRTAATLAGGAGLGIAGVDGVAAAQDAGRPHELIVAGNDRWYPIATVGELPPGGIKPFSAGGLLGFLLNTGGRLHAVSAICTHMGCRLKPISPAQGEGALHCLCHASRFNRTGEVMHGAAPSALPKIALRVEGGQVYALGTRESP